MFGFARFRKAPDADVGFQDYIYQPGLSFLPVDTEGTGRKTDPPPSIKRGSVLAIASPLVSGLPGVLIPSFRTQPLSPNNPTG